MRRGVSVLLAGLLLVTVTEAPVAAAETDVGPGPKGKVVAPDPIQTVKAYVAREAAFWGAIAGTASGAFVTKFNSADGTVGQKIDAGLKAAYPIALGGVITAACKTLFQSWGEPADSK